MWFVILHLFFCLWHGPGNGGFMIQFEKFKECNSRTGCSYWCLSLPWLFICKLIIICSDIWQYESVKRTWSRERMRKQNGNVEVSANKHSLTITVDSPRTKATVNKATEYCVLSSCGSVDRKSRRHDLAKDLPAVFKDSTSVKHLSGAVQDLR